MKKCLLCNFIGKNQQSLNAHMAFHTREEKDRLKEKRCIFCNKIFIAYQKKLMFCSRICFGKAHTGPNGVFYGKTHTEEARKKISYKNLGNQYAKGTKRSEETKKKLSESKKGKNHPFYNKKRPRHSQIMKERVRKGIWNYPSKNLEARKKIGLKSKERMLKNNPFKGKTHPSEIKKIISKKAIERWADPEEKKKHWNWNNGSSFEPYTYDFNRRFKEIIRKRDNHVCMLCNKSQEELKRKLDIHHVDYDKLNSFPQNCISLCHKCHLLTNNNRNHWTKFFQSLLKELYQYEYTEDQKIILDFNKKPEQRF